MDEQSEMCHSVAEQVGDSAFEGGYTSAMIKVKEVVNKPITIRGNFTIDDSIVEAAIILERDRILKELGIK